MMLEKDAQVICLAALLIMNREAGPETQEEEDR